MAAVSFSLVEATPYQLRYELQADGAPTVGKRTRTQLLSDAAAGPLATELRNAVTSSDWFALGVENGRVSVYFRANDPFAPLPPSTPAVQFGEQDPDLGLFALLSANTSAQVDVRFNHSNER